MKNVRNSIIAITLATIAAGSVLAADMTPKTRDQVRAELAQAQRDGNTIANGETGVTFRAQNPGRYMQPAMTSGISRDQVRAELTDAQRNGTTMANSQTGATFRAQNPGRYMQPAMTSGISRDQVRAELMEAQRNGTTMANSQTGATFREVKMN